MAALTSRSTVKKVFDQLGGSQKPPPKLLYVLVKSAEERKAFDATPPFARVADEWLARQPLSVREWTQAVHDRGTTRVVRRGLYDKQYQFRKLKASFRGFCAGRGSGKSEVGADYILSHAVSGDPWLAISPDANVVMSTTWPIFERLAKERGRWIRGVKSPVPQAWFRTNDGGVADIMFKSAERPDKLRGSSNAGLWFDEASVMSEAAFQTALLCRRWRGRLGPCILTFTPRGKSHWTFGVFHEECDDAESEILEDETEDHSILGDLSVYTKISGRWYRTRDRTALIKAHSKENPFLPEGFVEESASHMSKALQDQELAAEFVDAIGLFFQRDWFMPLVQKHELPIEGQRVRYWDRASSTAKSACYTAGVLMCRDRHGVFWVEDVVRGQWTYEKRNAAILDTARKDAAKYGNTVQIYGEQEGGSAGKEVSEQFIKMLAGFPVHKDVVSGKGTKLIQGLELPNKPKIIRAQGLIAQAEARNVRVLAAKWTEDFLSELIQFPLTDLCDQVDACSGCTNKLSMMWTSDPGHTFRIEPQVDGERFGVHLDKGGRSGRRRV